MIHGLQQPSRVLRLHIHSGSFTIKFKAISYSICYIHDSACVYNLFTLKQHYAHGSLFWPLLVFMLQYIVNGERMKSITAYLNTAYDVLE